jgi:putative ATP-dependent endonuclease of the OLD family
MHITELRIRNFRNFLKAKVSFREGVNTLIGENGSGKTNVMHAIRLLLDESLERNAIYLKETDFCRDIASWRAHWIIISAQFADLDPKIAAAQYHKIVAEERDEEHGSALRFAMMRRRRGLR